MGGLSIWHWAIVAGMFVCPLSIAAIVWLVIHLNKMRKQ